MIQTTIGRSSMVLALAGWMSLVWVGCWEGAWPATLSQPSIPAESAAYKAYKEHCASPLVICLDHHGGLFSSEVLPSSIDPGATLMVKVLVPAGRKEELTGRITVTITPRRNTNRLFQTSDQVLPGRVRVAAGVEDQEWEPLDTLANHQVAPDTDAHKVIIVFDNTVDGQTTSHAIPIDLGKHYMQIGLLVPFVYAGARSIISGTVPGTELRRAVTSRDTAITAALSLTFYPWGRRNGLLSPWELGHSRHAWADMMGFHVAKDFDFTQARGDWYLGVAIQPINGLILTVGGSLRRGQYLAEGESAARLYGPEETIPTSTRYMMRPYVGVMFTQDVLDGIKRALVGLQGLRGD